MAFSWCKEKELSSFHVFFMVKIKKPYIKFSSDHDNCGEEPAYVHDENTTYVIFLPCMAIIFCTMHGENKRNRKRSMKQKGVNKPFCHLFLDQKLCTSHFYWTLPSTLLYKTRSVLYVCIVPKIFSETLEGFYKVRSLYDENLETVVLAVVKYSYSGLKAILGTMLVFSFSSNGQQTISHFFSIILIYDHPFSSSFYVLKRLNVRSQLLASVFTPHHHEKSRCISVF